MFNQAVGEAEALYDDARRAGVDTARWLNARDAADRPPDGADRGACVTHIAFFAPLLTTGGTQRHLQQVEEFPSIAAGQAEQGFFFFEDDLPV